MTDPVTVPVPLEPLKEDIEDKRLWVGNLDPRVTELLQVQKKYDKSFTHKFTELIKITELCSLEVAQLHLYLYQDIGSQKAVMKFDMLFHRSGPLEGQPRGYAFVTYSSTKVAETAKQHLDGMLVGSKKICVKWAHTIPKNDLEKQKTIPEILTLGGSKTQSKLSRQTAIKAIEAKLKLMESASELSDFKISDKPMLSQSSSSVFSDQYKFNKSKHVNKYKMKPYVKGKGKS